MQVRTSLLERSKALLKQLKRRLLRTTEEQDEQQVVRALVDQYEELKVLTIWQLFDRIDQLLAEGTDTKRSRDYQRVAKYGLQLYVDKFEAMNETVRKEFENYDDTPMYTPEHFPREWFMDYSPEQPKYGVGDILFLLDYEDGDETKSFIREVVVTCAMSDIFEITYMVATHDPRNPICTSDFFEITEDRLAFRKEELDPRRKRFEVVKS